MFGLLLVYGYKVLREDIPCKFRAQIVNTLGRKIPLVCVLRVGDNMHVRMVSFVMKGGTIGSEIKVWRDLVSDISEEALDRDASGSVAFVRHVFGI